MNKLELGVALFQWAMQILGTEVLSVTKVTSPDPVRKVISDMIAGEELKGRHTQRWSANSRRWRPLYTRSQRRRRSSGIRASSLWSCGGVRGQAWQRRVAPNFKHSKVR